MSFVTAFRQAMLPADADSSAFACLRPMLMLCMLLAPLDLLDATVLGELELLIETELEFAMGELGFDFMATLVAPIAGSLFLLFAGERLRRKDVPDAIPFWRLQGLRPCPPLVSSHIPI